MFYILVHFLQNLHSGIATELVELLCIFYGYKFSQEGVVLFEFFKSKWINIIKQLYNINSGSCNSVRTTYEYIYSYVVLTNILNGIFQSWNIDKGDATITLKEERKRLPSYPWTLNCTTTAVNLKQEATSAKWTISSQKHSKSQRNAFHSSACRTCYSEKWN